MTPVAQEPPRPPKTERPSRPLPAGMTREQWQAAREAEIRKRLPELQEQASWLERVARVQRQSSEDRHA